MAQRYFTETARVRMAEGRCPECGTTPDTHTDDIRFWIPRRCDLTPHGVTSRIQQYRADLNQVTA
jgi:hypothetical protein